VNPQIHQKVLEEAEAEVEETVEVVTVLGMTVAEATADLASAEETETMTILEDAAEAAVLGDVETLETEVEIEEETEVEIEETVEEDLVLEGEIEEEDQGEYVFNFNAAIAVMGTNVVTCMKRNDETSGTTVHILKN